MRLPTCSTTARVPSTASTRRSSSTRPCWTSSINPIPQFNKSVLHLVLDSAHQIVQKPLDRGVKEQFVEQLHGACPSGLKLRQEVSLSNLHRAQRQWVCNVGVRGTHAASQCRRASVSGRCKGA